MNTRRLKMALDGGGLVLPAEGTVAVLLPTPEHDLAPLPRERLRVVQPFRPFHDHFAAAGFDCATAAEGPCAAAILFLPRARALARAMIAESCRSASDLVVVDGAKTDGIDSLLKEVRRRVAVAGAMVKAHGRIFWFRPDARAFADWRAAGEQRADGFVTAPGVFSADGIDPASRLLADALPERPGRRVADFGAGWGYLSARLAGCADIETLHLVEADRVALDCARINVSDPRARFHWADACAWQPPEPLDAVVTNPPFHTGRAADPDLGRAFAEAAARVLSPSGSLWLVANRHLPYEATLAALFREIRKVGGDNRFKILYAARPLRRGSRAPSRTSSRAGG